MKNFIKSILLLSILLISNFSFAQTVDEKTNEKLNINSDNNDLANKICGASYISWGGANPVKALEMTIINEIGVEADDPLRSQKISDFFNKNHDRLICGDDTRQKFRKREHFFKRAIAFHAYVYFDHLAESDDYSINMNTYEIIDGKKETLIDYVDKILNDPEKRKLYNVDGLKNLRITLEELGVTKGEEL
ncbi:hypothetical protein SAMN05216503_2019 [Polaribacter sp. KT25b]|uniref:hypothetical protein n=1 Tax=Polaribacter sp. KT25b TaxID=1855336 RepID=UPI00087DEB61|nr:hypothetical protein [Polaribacter sp. KT25b]SDS11446.1 hypothetical protein SAMN05216503_2019 [Polaribacter sp. KT25b]